jgi:hypothetical protein
MATTKKPAVKKTTRKAKTPVKKTAAKKSLADIDSPMRSFHISRDAQPFFGVHTTRQTVYWIILMAFIMIMQLSILVTQLNVLKAVDGVTTLL